MLNFYKIVKENLSFNRFQFRDTVCLEYTCPIDAEEIGIFSKNDYVVYVLSGKKTYRTFSGEWTLEQGQMLYLKKGAEVIHQYFDDEYCMLAFFLSDDLISDCYEEAKGKMPLSYSGGQIDFEGLEIEPTDYLEGYFYSMLNYFRGNDRPPDQIMVLKLKELLYTLMTSNGLLTSYFANLKQESRPSLRAIMEKNFCFNLKLEDFAELSHRSLSTFKRDFQKEFNESPGQWLLKRRANHAAKLLFNPGTSISDAAFETGFEDLSHFSRSFKKVMGCSPTEYRKSLLKN